MLHYTEKGNLMKHKIAKKTGRAFIRIDVNMGGQELALYASYGNGLGFGEVWTPVFEEAYAYSSREEARCLIEQLKNGEMRHSFDKRLVCFSIIDEVALIES